MEGFLIGPIVILVVRCLITALLLRTYTDLVWQERLLWSFMVFLINIEWERCSAWLWQWMWLKPNGSQMMIRMEFWISFWCDRMLCSDTHVFGFLVVALLVFEAVETEGFANPRKLCLQRKFLMKRSIDTPHDNEVILSRITSSETRIHILGLLITLAITRPVAKVLFLFKNIWSWKTDFYNHTTLNEKIFN